MEQESQEMEKNNFSKPRTFLDKLKKIFSKGPAGEQIDELEETLIEADIDLDIVGELLDKLKDEKISSYDDAKNFLKNEFVLKLKPSSLEKKLPGKVILLVGMNGAGKTTTAAKLANILVKQGKKVLFAAADTFRAAAIEQLETWAGRGGIGIIKGTEGGDPAAVAFDAVQKAKKENFDHVIIDTAGRLHTKTNLMQELAKIKRVVSKDIPGDEIETLIVIDANTGKNAYNQAKEFNSAMSLDGVILTKFDSSAKGGSIIRIRHELDLPIKYMTFGENVEDISEFNADEFVEGLFE
jgi:fused signal recognition particle receptor